MKDEKQKGKLRCIQLPLLFFVSMFGLINVLLGVISGIDLFCPFIFIFPVLKKEGGCEDSEQDNTDEKDNRAEDPEECKRRFNEKCSPESSTRPAPDIGCKKSRPGIHNITPAHSYARIEEKSCRKNKISYK